MVSLNFPGLPAPRRWLWRALLSCAVLSGPVAGLAEPGRSAAELEQLRRSIGALQQQLAAEREQEKSVTGELEKLERQLIHLAAQRRQETTWLQQVEKNKAELEQGQRRLEKKRREYSGDLIKLVRASYLLGQQSGLKLILSQNNPAEISRSLSIFRYLSKERNRYIEEGGKLAREYAKTAADLDQRRRQSAESLQRLERNQAQLDAQRARREQHLGAIRAQMEQNRRQVVVFTQREQELERLLARLRRQSLAGSRPSPPQSGDGSSGEVVDSTTTAEATPKSTAGQGQSRAPEAVTLGGFRQYKGVMGAPVSGRIAARFGQRKPESGLKWEGLMFETAEGQEVVAIYPGQVVFSDWFRGYGQLMVLDHGDGYMSLYGHNRLLRADIGAAVEAGESIGEAGSTGGLIRPGLYFEIRHNGEPRDPLEWCRI